MQENDWQILRYFLLIFLFMEISTNEKIYVVIFDCFRPCSIHIGTVNLLPFLRLFQTIQSHSFYWKAFALSKRQSYALELWYPSCTNQSSRSQKRFSVGLLNCSKCLNFFTKSQNDTNYHIAKEHSAAKPVVNFKCQFCYQKFPGFYALRQHKNAQHGLPIKTTDIDPDEIINKDDDVNLKEAFHSCQHFSADSELERARHKIFNYSIEKRTQKISTKCLINSSAT